MEVAGWANMYTYKLMLAVDWWQMPERLCTGMLDEVLAVAMWGRSRLLSGSCVHGQGKVYVWDLNQPKDPFVCAWLAHVGPVRDLHSANSTLITAGASICARPLT